VSMADVPVSPIASGEGGPRQRQQYEHLQRHEGKEANEFRKRMLSSGISRRVALVKTDVSGEYIDSVFMVNRFSVLLVRRKAVPHDGRGS
jgi:hypothetical protein